MPIRGDRLRWPPRPGKKASEATGTRRVSSADSGEQMRRPDERDESAGDHAHTPDAVIKQAHDDIKDGKQDTDCRNKAAEVVERASTLHLHPARPTARGKR